MNIQISFRTKILALVISTLLSIPMLGSIFDNDKVRAKLEKRSLADFPAWQGSLNADYFNDISSYFDDHIGFAVPLNRVYRKTLFYLFKDSPIENVTIGSSGYIFLNSHNPENINSTYRSLCEACFKKDKIELRRKQLIKIFTALENRGYRVSLGIAISKPILYPEYLPNTVPKNIKLSCLSYKNKKNMIDQISDSDFFRDRVIYYPYKKFRQVRNQKAFYPKENFHWKGKSAHVFSEGFLKSIGIPVSENFNKKGKVISCSADLKGLGFTRRINVWDYAYSEYGVKKAYNDKDLLKRYYKRAHDFSDFVTQNSMSDRRALLLSNSFGAYTAPHLAPGFKTLKHININHLKPGEHTIFFNEYIDKINPTDIIFLTHDEALVNGVFYKSIFNTLSDESTPDVKS